MKKINEFWSLICFSLIACLSVPVFAFAIDAPRSARSIEQDAAKNTDVAKSSKDESDNDEKKSKRKARGDKSKYDMDLFLRVRRDRRRKPLAMETSVTRYETKNDDGERVTVDLIGVVHIGEGKYYRALNRQFKKYDAVLYELVAPEGTRIPKGGRGGGGMNPVAALQQGMQSVLGLEFQLDHIDYTVKNFVHADMTPEEFLESMEKNDESFFKIALKAIGQSMAMQHSGQMTEFDLLSAMFSNNREQKMRRLMAEQMKDMESGMVIFEGKDGSTIINHRNTKALQIMQDQIGAGKKNLAIFYGAGHLPDMDEKLLKKFGMKRGGQFWLTAWDLK